MGENRFPILGRRLLGDLVGHSPNYRVLVQFEQRASPLAEVHVVEDELRYVHRRPFYPPRLFPDVHGG